MGTLYDRKQIVGLCGTPEDPCRRGWAGMMLTQPALAVVDQTPVVMLPTFMPDTTQPAGASAGWETHGGTPYLGPLRPCRALVHA